MLFGVVRGDHEDEKVTTRTLLLRTVTTYYHTFYLLLIRVRYLLKPRFAPRHIDTYFLYRRQSLPYGQPSDSNYNNENGSGHYYYLLRRA
jgi:hypothetical protein